MFCFRFVSFRFVPFFDLLLLLMSRFFFSPDVIETRYAEIGNQLTDRYVEIIYRLKRKKKMRVAKQRAIFRKFFFSLLNSGFLSGSCQDSPWFPLFLYFPLFLFFVFVFSLMGLDFFFSVYFIPFSHISPSFSRSSDFSCYFSPSFPSPVELRLCHCLTSNKLVNVPGREKRKKT